MKASGELTPIWLVAADPEGEMVDVGLVPCATARAATVEGRGCPFEGEVESELGSEGAERLKVGKEVRLGLGRVEVMKEAWLCREEEEEGTLPPGEEGRD